jgi:hypothetical protein
MQFWLQLLQQKHCCNNNAISGVEPRVIYKVVSRKLRALPTVYSAENFTCIYFMLCVEESVGTTNGRHNLTISLRAHLRLFAKATSHAMSATLR